MKKTILLFFLFLFSAFSLLFGQPFPMGAVLDRDLYESLPRKATQLSRGSLPESFSLKQYAPFVENQWPYGTCSAWATAYAARTIAESIALNRLDRSLTTSNVFSPAFVYKSVTNQPHFTTGIPISHALNVMKTPGAPRRNNEERTGDYLAVPLSVYQQSLKYPIEDYTTIYNNPRAKPGNDISGVVAIKKSLSEGKPVIIGMNTPESFHHTKSPWLPYENPYVEWGGHAMCVVGYDDTKYGGAFEIQNSWGKGWGEDGYVWIPYDVFVQFVDEAYELIENLSTYKDATLYSGFVDIEVDNSIYGMPIRFDENGFYRTVNSYPSGTRFRFIMGNNHPAYVYAFTADSATTKTNLIFPLAERNESPVLDYSENMIAWPNEHDWMQMDDVTGTDYLVVLYSKQELDIDTISSRFANITGNFPERVARAVGSDYVHHSYVKYENSQIRFSGSMDNKNAVIGLLLAIDHH